MYYGEMKKMDIANGIGIRVSLYVSGCTNHCEKCFQPETWDFHYGQPFTQDAEQEIMAALRPDYVYGLAVLGGEPLEPQNQRDLMPILQRIRVAFPQKDIWVFTGFVLETELQQPSNARCEITDELLAQIDVLVDGRYVEALRDLSLQFRGSSNQRIIDLNRSRVAGETVLWSEK